ncbi:MAG: radical SAM protein [Bdellovibrionota bacterium]
MEPYYFNLEFHLTNRCNLNCSYCYHVNHIDKNLLSTKQKKKVISDFVELCRSWQVHPFVIFGGGEPLLAEDFIEIASHYHEVSHGSEYSIVTNGTLFPPKGIEAMSSHHVRSIQISLDGANQVDHDAVRGKGTFEKIRKNILALQKYNFSLSLNVVLTKNTFNKIADFFSYAKEAGVNALSFTRMVPVGIGASELDQMLEPRTLKECFWKYSDKVKVQEFQRAQWILFFV